MPAYCHIYNRGVEGKDIFRDEEDCRTFLGYLKEYLSPVLHPKDLKREFTVNGRTYHGLPHQPKNYHGKIELIAYSLSRDQFHLVVNELEKGAQTRLLRSIGTRYSMYYNKKYSRRGALYEGPYKSTTINDVSLLPHYVRLFHAHKPKEHPRLTSFTEYVADKKPIWINTGVILGLVPNFKRFSDDINSLNEDRKNIGSGVFAKVDTKEETQPTTLVRSNPVSPDSNSTPTGATLKVPEFIAASVGIFVVLFTLGLRSVSVHSATITANIAENPTEIESPEVSGVSDFEEYAPEDSYSAETISVDELIEALEKKTFIEINAPNANQYVNIRLNPTINSEIVQKAKNGDTFEYVETVDGWHRIKLQDGLAYVSAEYSNLLLTP